MTYIEDLKAEFMAKYDEAQSEEEIFAWIFEKVLQSYKNGIKAGQQGTQVIPHGKSRRPFPPQAR